MFFELKKSAHNQVHFFFVSYGDLFPAFCDYGDNSFFHSLEEDKFQRKLKLLV